MGFPIPNHSSNDYGWLFEYKKRKGSWRRHRYIFELHGSQSAGGVEGEGGPRISLWEAAEWAPRLSYTLTPRPSTLKVASNHPACTTIMTSDNCHSLKIILSKRSPNDKSSKVHFGPIPTTWPGFRRHKTRADLVTCAAAERKRAAPNPSGIAGFPRPRSRILWGNSVVLCPV